MIRVNNNSKIDIQNENCNLRLKLKENGFKDHHICDGCGNPLSKCTCSIEEAPEAHDSDTKVVGSQPSSSSRIYQYLVNYEYNPDNEIGNIYYEIYNLSNEIVDVIDDYNLQDNTDHQVVINVILPDDIDVYEYEDKLNTLSDKITDVVYIGDITEGCRLEDFGFASSATQPSSIGQHKSCSIDMIGTEESELNDINDN